MKKLIFLFSLLLFVLPAGCADWNIIVGSYNFTQAQRVLAPARSSVTDRAFPPELTNCSSEFRPWHCPSGR
jgi:hypothetical protein